jgi:heme-degrading monooxygenase HmoA
VIAVIFEVVPAPGRKQQYLDLAAALKQELGSIDGFISVERFQSLGDPDKMLSLSFFQDEDAVMQWRNTAAHRAAQGIGRGGLFAAYRLRIADVARDYGKFERAEAPDDSRAAHQPRSQAIEGAILPGP